MGDVMLLIFTLMVAPDATDMGVEVYADDVSVHHSLSICHEQMKLLQNENPPNEVGEYYFCI